MAFRPERRRWLKRAAALALTLPVLPARAQVLHLFAWARGLFG